MPFNPDIPKIQGGELQPEQGDAIPQETIQTLANANELVEAAGEDKELAKKNLGDAMLSSIAEGDPEQLEGYTNIGAEEIARAPLIQPLWEAYTKGLRESEYQSGEMLMGTGLTTGVGIVGGAFAFYGGFLAGPLLGELAYAVATLAGADHETAWSIGLGTSGTTILAGPAMAGVAIAGMALMTVVEFFKQQADSLMNLKRNLASV